MFLLIDKPRGMTSHDVVDRVRKITGEKRVGHAGTLDQNATGLLIIGVGRESTKRLWTISAGKKSYVAEICLGEVRDTDDVEGKVISKSKSKRVSLEKIENTLRKFIGEQEQVPPLYSAIKISGRKAYEMARKGKEIKLKPRKVVVYSTKVLDYRYPILKIAAEVSSGTYIRSLARDIGDKLGTGAYLKELRRTRIGKFDIKESVGLEELSETDIGTHAIHLD